MGEQLPRYDEDRREDDGSRPHDMEAPAVLHATREGRHWDQRCNSAAAALIAAAWMLHRGEGTPDRIVFDDGADIAGLAIRQEYERMRVLGEFDGAS